MVRWTCRVLASPFLLMACFGAVLVPMDVWRSIIVPDPEWIDGMHFGECMAAHGGWQFSSAEAYGWTMLWRGSALGVTYGMTAFAILGRSWRLGIAALALFLLQDLGMQVAEARWQADIQQANALR